MGPIPSGHERWSRAGWDAGRVDQDLRPRHTVSPHPWISYERFSCVRLRSQALESKRKAIIVEKRGQCSPSWGTCGEPTAFLRWHKGGLWIGNLEGDVTTSPSHVLPHPARGTESDGYLGGPGWQFLRACCYVNWKLTERIKILKYRLFWKKSNTIKEIWFIPSEVRK